MNILVTGGCGFIGSHYLLKMVKKYPNDTFVCFDKLTYAANNGENIKELMEEKNFHFEVGDIASKEDLKRLDEKYKFNLIVNFAAETHVDNSFETPELFYKSNLKGVLCLLEFMKQNDVKRFHQVSTDEVYGGTEIDSNYKYVEEDRFKPSSPYAASKAAADDALRIYHDVFGFDITITRSVNNYGKFQHEEKFIPKVVKCLKNNESIPVYGDGKQIRSWIDVEKHIEYIDLVSRYAPSGEVYNIAGEEINNLDLIERIAKYLGIKDYKIKFVKDRPNHDRRLALDDTKIKKFLAELELQLI